jgi:hypothetical protein
MGAGERKGLNFDVSAAAVLMQRERNSSPDVNAALCNLIFTLALPMSDIYSRSIGSRMKILRLLIVTE